MDETARFFGIIEKPRPPKPPPVFKVWPANWAAVELFLDVQTQWRFAGMGGVRVGLDYGAVRDAMDLLETPKRGETFRRLQLMEYAALEALAQQERKRQDSLPTT